MPPSATLEERLAAIAGQAESENRRADRISFRHDSVQIDVLDGSGGPGLVAAYDLSEGGMGFISEGAIEAGTTVLLELHRADGKFDRVSGRVVRCRSIAGKWHSVGVRFENRIDVRNYMRA